VRPENFDFLGNLNGMWAIFLGAVLATVGGLAATQLEWYFERRRRAQHAAQFFGEVLTTLGYILKIARDTYARGEPFGPITMRMLRSAKREIDIYDRNRETLYDLDDAKLRARIHTLILRLNTPLEGVFDTHDEIRAVETQLKSPGFPAAHRDEALARLERLTLSRLAGYEFTMETAEQINPTVRELEPIAGHSFDGLGREPA
jgi:hypothetical protein